MSTPATKQEDFCVIRLYWKFSKSSYPQLAALLDGLSTRDRNRQVQALVARGARIEFADTHQYAAAASQRPLLTRVEGDGYEISTSADLQAAFGISLAEPAV